MVGWHRLDNMQIICTSLQTDSHASTSSPNDATLKWKAGGEGCRPQICVARSSMVQFAATVFLPFACGLENLKWRCDTVTCTYSLWCCIMFVCITCHVCGKFCTCTVSVICEYSAQSQSLYHTTTTTVLWPVFRDHPGEPAPEENFWTLWCKGRLTKADTPTIQLGATPSGLTIAHLHHPPTKSLMNRYWSHWPCYYSREHQGFLT